MPWKAMSEMDSREEFVRLAEQGEVPIAELCRRFGVSRDSGHRLLRRVKSEGQAGLRPRSRRPHGSPKRTSEAMEAEVLGLRERHPAWGGRKLARRLKDLGRVEVPAPSTVTDILRRHGRLAEAAGAERPRVWRRFERAAPNELWQMDFKGHFAMDRGRCHALTVLDDHSRYALGLRACGDETDQTVRGELSGLFRRYGLPEAMLADNGPPWGCTGSEYTALGVWLLRLGVVLHHGRPLHPQTQGRDERFHETLDVELLQMRRFADLSDCQAGFDAWRRIYNQERPHEALALATPATRYQASTRSFPEHLPEPQYHASDVIRRIRWDGVMKFRGQRYKLSQAFAGLPVALRPTQADGLWKVYFSRFEVAEINSRHPEAPLQPVRHLPEHLSGLSPV